MLKILTASWFAELPAGAVPVGISRAHPDAVVDIADCAHWNPASGFGPFRPRGTSNFTATSSIGSTR
jgi:hypothetical protein